MDAVHEQGTIGLQFLRAEGLGRAGVNLDPVIEKRLADEKTSSQAYGPDYGAHNFLMRGVIGTAKVLPYFLLDKAVRGVAGAAGAAVGVGAGAETGPGAIATGVGGTAVAQFAASGVFNYAEALGPLSWELDHLKDENGKPINPVVANVAAQAGSVASGALMSGLMGVYGGKAGSIVEGYVQRALPSVAKAITAASETGVAKWLADGEVRSLVSKFVGRWGLHTALGAAMMAVNGAVLSGTAELAKAASGMDASANAVGHSMWESGKQALRDMWLFSAYAPLREAWQERGLARASAQDAVKLQAAIGAAQASTLLDKSPEGFKQVVDLTAADTKVYVPAERWASYFQEKKLDPGHMAESLGVAPEQLETALRTGGNLEFKASDFLAGLAKDGHAQALSMDIKTDPELLTAREFQARQESEAKRMVEDAKTRATELDVGKQRIEQFLLDQAKASKLSKEEMAGVKKGVPLLTESVATQALKLNVSMNEAARLMNLGDLTITGKTGPTPAHEDALKSFREWLAPSASQQLKAKFESMSPENQARAVYLDPNTGLPNAAHFEDLNDIESANAFPEDDRPFANVGIAGTKYINDNLDHGAGDMLYRAAGKALHDAAPEVNVSKPGGDFEFRARDQAHLDEILKKANENLPEQLKPFVLTGAVGASREKASEAHVELKQAGEAAGTRAPRTDANNKALPPLGFKGEAKDVAFPSEKVAREPHPEVAKAFSDLSPEEKFDKAFVEPQTGLLTGLGWKMLDHDPNYHYSLLDLRGLKDANKLYGKDGGDKLIEGFGAVLSHFGGSSFDAAHLHGDEYALRHRDPYKLAKFIETVRENLKDVFDAEYPDGEKVGVSVDFWHGIARGSIEAADHALNERKAGAKAEAGGVPARAPAGVENHGDEGGRKAGLEFRREGLGRGASPQGFPGADRRSFNQEAVVPRPVLDAQAYVGRMRDPEKKAAAQAFLDYVTGKTDKRPAGVPPEVEKRLAGEWGLVDPEGFSFDEGGRDMSRPVTTQKVRGPEPEELRRYRLMNVEHRTGVPQKYNQEPIAYVEGQPVTFEQGPKNLLVQHNLREDNLQHADELGGLAAPSLAVARKEHPLMDFGEVTLLADKELVNPKRTPVFGSDIYSPRYPDTHFKVKDAEFKELTKWLAPFVQRTEGYLGDFRDKVEGQDPADIVHNGYIRPALQVAWLEQEKGQHVPGVGRTEIRDAAEMMVDREGKKAFEAWAKAKVSAAQGEQLITRYTASGNKRGIPYTLENVLREVTKKIRQGETFNYGLGTARAAGSKKFTSLEQIQKARDRIVSSGEFGKLKEQINGRLVVLAEELQPHHQGESAFRLLDDLATAIGESFKRGRSLRGELAYSFKDVPQELVTKVADLAADLLAMPTEYFEAKPQRAVTLDEFKAAVVPHDASAQTLAVLKKHGVEAHAYKRGNEADRQRAIAEASAKHDILFQDPTGGSGGEGPRGFIRLDLGGSGRPRAFDIRMLGGDRSTFAHEVAHFLSWSLHDLATSDLATDPVRADYDTLLKFMGYGSADERLKAVQEGAATKQEEKVSHAFEAYLQDGKAPSSALARVFSRFKDWLVRIYKGTQQGPLAQYQARYGEELQLSPEVKGVFDRLLAQDEALKQAADAVGGAGELKDALAGMTPEQADTYRQALADARVRAEQETAAGGDERQQRLEAQREAFRQQTEAEVDARPVYRAWRYLQHGDLPESASGAISPEQFQELWRDEKGKPFKISRGDFERELPLADARKMPPGSLKVRGGRPVEEVATRLGFSSAQEMVEALTGATPRDEAIAQGTQDKMDAAHGPELERLTQAALSGVHNPRDLEAAVMELRALAKQINPEMERRASTVDVDALRQNIDRLTGEKRVEQLDPATYARAERRLALEAAELWGRGEKEASYEKREQRLVNKLLFMSERDAKKRLDAARQRLANPSAEVRGRLGKADPAYRDVHDAILHAVGLGPAPLGGATLDNMLEVARNAAQDIDFDVEGIRDLLTQPRQWDSGLTVADANGVVDAITNIRTAARRSLEVKVAGRMQDKEEFIQKLVDSVQQARPSLKKLGVQRSNRGPAETARQVVQGVDAALSDMDSLAFMLDGGNRDGPVHQLFVDQRHASREVVTKLTKQVLEPVVEKWLAMPKEVRELMGRDFDFSELPLPPSLARFEDNRTRAALHMVFLNWGNEGNRQRLLDGMGWEQRAVERALSQLHPEEADFLQTVLDVTDGLYEPMAANHEEDTGLRPPKVAATPITINGKEYRGGYFPAKYDYRASRTGARQLAADIKSVAQVFSEAYQRATTAKSHTKERAAEVRDAPLDLDHNVIAAHLSQVINDIANRSYVKDAAGILLDDRVRNVMEEKVGPERAKQFMPVLQTVANSQVDSAAANLAVLQRVNSWLRTRMALQAVGWSVRSAVGVAFDPLNAVAARLVSAQHMTPALVKTWNPATFGQMHDAALALSPELQSRDVGRNLNLRNVFDEVLGKPRGTLAKIRDTAFWFHTVVDKRNETAVWTARFNQSLVEGRDQELAIRDADDAVRAVTPSHDAADKAAILRSNSGIAGLLTFYGYSNKVYNLHRRNFDAAYLALVGEKPTGEKVADLARYAGTALALIASHGVMAEYFTGRGKEDDETEAHWLMRKAVIAPLQVLPFVGPLAEAVIMHKKPGVHAAPAAAFLEEVATRLANLTKKSEDQPTEEKLLSLVETLAGFVTGAPTAAINRPLEYAKKVKRGEARVRGPLDAISGTVYGYSKAKPANPLTDVQKVISGR
jgi:GGDEF domain-containing protein